MGQGAKTGFPLESCVFVETDVLDVVIEGGNVVNVVKVPTSLVVNG